MMNTSDIFRFLVKAGSSAPSADNMQPWSFVLDGNDFVLRYDPSRFPNAIFPGDHHATRMAMGAVIENLREAAHQLGLRANVGFDRSGAVNNEFCRFAIPSTLNVDCPRVASIYERHTNRLPYDTEPLPDELLSKIAASRVGDAKIIVKQTVPDIRRISGFVKTASKIRFQTQEIHEWFAQSLRFGERSVRVGNGLDVDTFDLPPGGSLLLKAITTSWRTMSAFNRVGGYHIMAGTEAGSLAKAGAILAVVAPSTAEGAIDSGRLMQKIWIDLNSLGYAVQPYYVVSDQLIRLAEGKIPSRQASIIDNLRQDVVNEFKLSDGMILSMLMRIGQPRHVPKRSLRLPGSDSVGAGV